MDEWTNDGFFSYTGEGQKGPMRFVSGNKAVRDHKTLGKSLHLFEQDKKDKRMLLYLGEMEYADHEIRPAPDKDKNVRDAIVFKLRPVGSLSPDSANVEAVLASEVGPGNKGTGFGSPETNRRVEKAAVDAVRCQYEGEGWQVVSVEADKLGYDLRCNRTEMEEHVEVKGTQSPEVCFIITANEVRNALIDRQHVTCIVSSALTLSPKITRIAHGDFRELLTLAPIAYRATMKKPRQS